MKPRQLNSAVSGSYEYFQLGLLFERVLVTFAGLADRDIKLVLTFSASGIATSRFNQVASSLKRVTAQFG
jgi:hypothetical protein